MKIYQIIGKLTKFKDQKIQAIFIGKTYKLRKNAEKFIINQQHNKKFYFEIQEENINYQR